jgi:hypothetical protein
VLPKRHSKIQRFNVPNKNSSSTIRWNSNLKRQILLCRLGSEYEFNDFLKSRKAWSIVVNEWSTICPVNLIAERRIGYHILNACAYIPLLFTLSASIIHLQVSTVGDKTITLPKDTASLYASAWPKETEGKITQCIRCQFCSIACFKWPHSKKSFSYFNIFLIILF